MTESVQTLLQDMKKYVAELPLDDERILAPVFGERIERVGEVALLVEVFREFADSTLTSWTLWLAFSWKDLSFQGWKQVLREISSELTAVYQFIWFATWFLAIDVAAMSRSDPEISKDTIAFIVENTPSGGPRTRAPWLVEMMEERGIDPEQMIRRLAQEGAPMYAGFGG
jgi:hypothetical protein